jgi:cytochrome c oxidase subunit I+III
VVGADLHLRRRRHAVHVAAVWNALSLDCRTQLAGRDHAQPSLALALVTVAALVVAAVAARGSLWALAAGGATRGWIGLALLALLAAIAADVALIGGVTPDPREHALGATACALLGYLALHAGIGILFLLSNLLRLGTGFVSARRSLDLCLTRLWLDYTVVTGAIALGLVLALPLLVAMLGARP